MLLFCGVVDIDIVVLADRVFGVVAFWFSRFGV